MRKNPAQAIQSAKRAIHAAPKWAKTPVFWLILSLFLATFIPRTTLSSVLPLGAASGERLHFDVSWLGIPAGKASMMLDVQAKRYILETTLSTTGMVRVVHSLDETMKAKGRLFGLTFQSKRYTKNQQKRGKTKITTYDFETDMRQVLRVQREVGRRNKEIRTIPLNSERTVDPLSGFYTLRAWPRLLPNSILNWFVVDGKKVFCLTISVGGSYRLETGLGWFTAFPVQIAVKNSKKFMNHTTSGDKKGAVVIWLTDDRRRIPIRVEAKMAFGSVVAELVAFEDGRGEKRAR